MSGSTSGSAPQEPTTARRGRSPWRWLAAIVGVVAIVLVVSYVVAAGLVYRELSVIDTSCETRNAANNPASFTVEPVNGVTVDATPYEMPDYREVSFPARNGGPTIRGWFVPSSTGATAPAVIVVHGKSSCRREDRILLASGMLHKHGFAVLMIDLRNHGESDRDNGRYAGGIKEYQDVLGAWDWLVGQGLPPARIGLLGESLGAGTTMIAAGEEPRVAAEWEDSGYADVEVAIRAELDRNHYPELLEPGGLILAQLIDGVDLTSKSPLKAMAKLHGRPIFIVHGTADERLSVQYASDLAAAVRANGGTVDPWIIPGVGHTQAVVLHAKEYEQKLADFFGAALGRP